MSLRNAIVLAALLAGPTVLANQYDNEWENVNASGRRQNTNEAKERVVEQRLNAEQSRDAEKMRVAASTTVRRFHEVLDELLAEFGYDVRMGQLKGLKNVAIRKVDVSDSLPHTYRTYLEMLVSERIRENSRVRLVSCVPCKSKTSKLVEGKLLISSPTTNMAQMQLAADKLGVDNFMDVIMVYHSTHMVLAMQIFNTETQDLVWTRTYNSETIRSRYQKLAVDYSQVEKSRPGEDYQPEYRFLFGFGGAVIPNVTGDSDDSGMFDIMVRGTEKFDNRKHEFGLALNMFIRRNAILKDHPTEDGGSGSGETTTSNLAPTNSNGKSVSAWSFALALLPMYSHNFLPSLESYDRIRHAANVGVGALLAPAYLAPTLRLGWDIFFGRRFATNIGLVYVAPSKVLIDDEFVEVDGGVGGELAMSINF